MTNSVISGVFCDIQGTLMDFLGENVQTEVLNILKEYEAKGKTIRLWTGGDLKDKDILSKLKTEGILWPILSKYDFKNCTVEIVVDDVPAEKLEKDYKIRAENYIHWNPDGI